MRTVPSRLLVPVVAALTVAAGWSLAPAAGAAPVPTAVPTAVPTPQVFRFNGGRDDLALAQTLDAAGNSYLAGTIAGSPLQFAVVKLNPRGGLVWRHVYGGSAGGTLGNAAAVALDPAGNVYAAGNVSTANAGVALLVVKLRPDGTEQWAQRTDTGAGRDFATRIAVGPGGEVYVAGDSLGAGLDWLTQQYGPDGTLRWSRRFTGAGRADDTVADMAVTPAGNLVVTGSGKLTGDEVTDDIVTVEYDPQGGTVWQRTFSDTAASDDNPGDLEVGAAGDVVVTGVAGRNASPENTAFAPVTLRYAPDGTLLQTIRAGGEAVHLDRAGDIYLAGSIDQAPGNSAVSKFGPTGAPVWSTRLAIAPNELLTIPGLVVDPAGTVTVAGTILNQTTLNSDYLTIRYAPNGQELWRQRFDGRGALTRGDTVAGIALDSANAVLVAGTSDSPVFADRQDMVELKFA